MHFSFGVSSHIPLGGNVDDIETKLECSRTLLAPVLLGLFKNIDRCVLLLINRSLVVHQLMMSVQRLEPSPILCEMEILIAMPPQLNKLT